MSVGSSATTNRFAIHQSLTNHNNNKKQMSNTATATAASSTASSHYYFNAASNNNNNNNSSKFSYRSCPICEQRLLVRINGSFVYKWISTHFSTHHHEWMHVIVNLHES
ncbi:hypothetical protein MAM1_0006d00771 [Mucor ambiguus]|uniref:Uncharacterized protein n=1 Tax=Mucor ambiguus TaxID=91626 RepID=A0A0C9MHB6_9FUNG|nr:hypothetical protein MAM1_0006d00771 [Mucor ambiguus]